jgi:hypothetical protein
MQWVRDAAAFVYPSYLRASVAALDIMRVADAEPITGRVTMTRGVIGFSAPGAVPLSMKG